MDQPNADSADYRKLFAATIRAVRLHRRMRPAEVAGQMGISPRTYEHFEAGRGRWSFERIGDFARATESDATAIVVALMMRSPDFAVHCADNKLMMIVLASLGDLNSELAADISFLDPRTIITAFDKVRKDLCQSVANRDLFAEMWLKEREDRLADFGGLNSLKFKRL